MPLRLEMASTRRAVIDVGTNSIKLLVADVSGHEVRPVREESHQTRLGRGFYKTLQLQAQPIGATARAVAEFAAKAREEKAISVRVIATSAARDATNAKELITAIQEASHLKVEIISGEQEADWAFQGAMTDPALAREPLLLLDVGGGSTEFILGHGEQKDFRQSFPMGTVRLLEEIKPGDPPAAGELAVCRDWVREFLEKEIAPKLSPAIRKEKKFESQTGHLQVVGTGGTASILGCMEAKPAGFDRERLEATRLSRESLRRHVEHLWSCSLSERKKTAGLPANRADVILTGTVIYEGVLEMFKFKDLRISTRGLRFAAVMQSA
jgi:exopolyphosphatase/guanosine-5'-triphosphate,3'-diphosphate pyrophosphatase